MSTANKTYRIISPDGLRKADIPEELLLEKQRAGWKIDPRPDTRGSLFASMPGLHKGRGAIVIASGPSAGIVPRDAVQRLVAQENLVVFGVNDADRSMGGQPVPNLNYLVVIDDGLWNDRCPKLLELLRNNPGSIPITHFEIQEEIDYIHAPIGIHYDPNMLGPRNIEYVVGRLFHGFSSGVAAVQIAMWMGCNPIYLLGHDLQCAHGKTHGFGVREAGERSRNYPQSAQMFAGYETLAYHAERTGTSIINLSPCSALKYFPVRPLPASEEQPK